MVSFGPSLTRSGPRCSCRRRSAFSEALTSGEIMSRRSGPNEIMTSTTVAVSPAFVRPRFAGANGGKR